MFQNSDIVPSVNQFFAEGVLFMEKWGKVKFDNQRNRWCVKGKWQGKRCYFSQIPALNGFLPCSTQEMAEYLQIEISKEIPRGTFNPARYQKAKPLHIEKYAQTWLKQVKPTLKYSSYRRYVSINKLYITPLLGNVFIADLNYFHYLKLWTDINKPKKYRKDILGVMYTMMEDARRAGHISQVPEKIIFKGKFTIPKKDPNWIDKKTQDHINSFLPKEDFFIFKFLQITGVRPSEARALQKADLYPEKGYIAIRWTLSEREGGEELSSVKQKRERRIPFYAELESLFKDMPSNLTKFVFVNPRTNKPYSHHFSDIWNDACKKVGIKIKLNNGGRHSWGNQRSAEGLDMETIRDGLGHAATQTARDNYLNPNMERLKKHMDNVRVLASRSDKQSASNGKGNV